MPEQERRCFSCAYGDGTACLRVGQQCGADREHWQWRGCHNCATEPCPYADIVPQCPRWTRRMPERSCATCGHNLHNWAKNTCGAGCVGTITHPHWRPRAGVQFVAPKAPYFLTPEGPKFIAPKDATGQRDVPLRDVVAGWCMRCLQKPCVCGPPKPGGFIEGLYRHCATNRTNVAPMTCEDVEKWASKMLGEDNRKETAMCETWQVEVVRVDRKTGRVVEYLLHLTTIENIQTDAGARQQALALAIKANPDATFGDDVDVNVRCPFRGQ